MSNGVREDTWRYSCWFLHPDIGVFADHGASAKFFGTTPRTVMRWIEQGVDWVTADVIATKLGHHPTRLWPEWADRTQAIALADDEGVQYPLFDLVGVGS